MEMMGCRTETHGKETVYTFLYGVKASVSAGLEGWAAFYYPIWWQVAAWPVNSFIEANDFTGKTVIPFCTSASSGLGESGELLAEMARPVPRNTEPDIQEENL